MTDGIFERELAQLRPSIHRLIARKFGGLDEAAREDVVQYALIKAWKFRHRLDHTRLFWWLCTVAINLATDEMRRAERLRTVQLPALADGTEVEFPYKQDLDGPLASRIAVEAVRRSVSKEDFRLLAGCAIYGSHLYARMTGQRASTVKPRLCRLQAKVRALGLPEAIA
jgi:DNA-directed RNA polymerase specialized sigma24 family protein